MRAQMADGQHASAPNLGLLYITDDYVDVAQDILDYLGAELPAVADLSLLHICRCRRIEMC